MEETELTTGDECDLVFHIEQCRDPEVWGAGGLDWSALGGSCIRTRDRHFKTRLCRWKTELLGRESGTRDEESRGPGEPNRRP